MSVLQIVFFFIIAILKLCIEKCLQTLLDIKNQPLQPFVSRVIVNDFK